MLKPRITLSLTVVLLLASVGLAGCSMLPWGQKTRSVSEPGNLFHVDVPVRWQTGTDQGFLTVYADEKLPAAGESPEALSVLFFTSSEASSAKEADVLKFLVDARAKQRGWTNVKTQPMRAAKVGKRAGQLIDVSATGSDNKPFDSRYYFVRTGGKEVLIAAIAPPAKTITDFESDLGWVTDNFFWHVPAK